MVKKEAVFAGLMAIAITLFIVLAKLYLPTGSIQDILGNTTTSNTTTTKAVEEKTTTTVFNESIKEVLRKYDLSKAYNISLAYSSNMQRVVAGTLWINISFIVDEKTGKLTIILFINDDDYNGEDAIALVFDTNRNDTFDKRDRVYYIMASNKVCKAEYFGGFITPVCNTYYDPVAPAYQKIFFDKKSGYVFVLEFPAKDEFHKNWNPFRYFTRVYSERTNKTDFYYCPLMLMFRDTKDVVKSAIDVTFIYSWR